MEADEYRDSRIERRADRLARLAPARALALGDAAPAAQEPLEIARLRRLFQRAPGFIAILRGPSHVYEFVNDAYTTLFGARVYLGRPARDVVPELETQGFIRHLDHVLTSGRRFVARRNALWVATAAGSRAQQRLLDFVYAPMTDPQNRVIGIFIEGFDVTSESDVTEHSVVGGRYWEICPDLLGLVRADGYFRRTNPAWQTLLGWSADEVAATSLYELLHPDDRGRTLDAFKLLQQGNPVPRFENRFRGRDGAYRWLAWSAVACGDAYYACGRDITAEKDTAAALAAVNVRHDRVWKNSRDMLVILDADGIFRAVSPAWTTILGHATADVEGRHFSELIWPDDAAGTQPALSAAVADFRLTGLPNRYRHVDGTPRWISWQSSTEGGFVYAYGRDVTSVKTAEDSLAMAEDALRQSQKMEAVGQLTGGIAHDFNNLLTGICGSLELLAAESADACEADRQQLIASARQAAGRAASLTQRLLAFSRRQTPGDAPVDVNRLVTGMQDLVQRTVGPRVAVHTDLAPGLWSIRVDANQLENALLNLCINGRDALPQGGGLLIKTHNARFAANTARAHDMPPGQYVCLSVMDAGTGMSPEVVAHAGDPFFTTKPSGKGTGLGLSMLYGFARQSSGEVRIESEMGKGSTVSLFIPRHTGRPAGAGVAAAPTPSLQRGRGETVLVVEDEPTVRVMVREMLKRFGYASVEAPDAAAGIRLLQTLQRVELLVTDVGLPGVLNGRQMADAARRLHPGIKVLFITGYAETALAEGGLLDTGMQLLTKPFAMADLIDRIDRLLKVG